MYWIVIHFTVSPLSALCCGHVSQSNKSLNTAHAEKGNLSWNPSDWVCCWMNGWILFSQYSPHSTVTAAGVKVICLIIYLFFLVNLSATHPLDPSWPDLKHSVRERHVFTAWSREREKKERGRDNRKGLACVIGRLKEGRICSRPA